VDRRRFLLTSLAGALAGPVVAEGQAGKIARVGYLGGAPREMLTISIPNFLAQLQEFQFIEGRNLVVEFRHADSQERFRQLATELARLGVQVIYATNPYALHGAREATKAVPIVGYD
jgi:putative ABC transport system substrate-binding protein